MSAVVFDTATRRPARTGHAAAAHIGMIKRFAKLVMAVGMMALVVGTVAGAKLAIFVPRVFH
jgi:hypothetical protein